MIKLKTKIGNSVLELEFQSQTEFFKLGSVYTQLPTKCTCCNSEDLGLFYRNPKDYDYYGVICRSCGASLNFGSYKKGGFFIKGDFEKFQTQETPQPSDNRNIDDVGF